MTKFLRLIGNATWALAFGLSILLAFAHHDYKPDISLGVSVLSLVLSALGLLLARHCRREGDFVAARIGVVVWMAGVLSFSVTEFGFWAASFKERHAQYVQIKAAKERQEGLKDMAWHALQTGETRATSAEIEARIRAAEQADAWQATKQCANATLPASRQFCKEYFELRAALAKAGKLEAIEASFLAEKPKADQQLANRVFAAADLIAENTSLDERQASALVILIVALVLMLARDLLPIAANPLGRGKPQVAGADVRKDIGQTGGIAAEASDKADVRPAEHSEMFVSPNIDPVANLQPASKEELQKLHDLVAEMKAAETEEARAAIAMAPELKIASADLPATEAETNVTPLDRAADDFETVVETASNVTKLFSDDMPRPMPSEHAFGAEVRIRRSQDDVKTFFRERLGIDQEARAAMLHAIKERKALDAKVAGRLMDSPDVYDLYLSWYGDDEEGAMGPKPFSNKLNDYLGIPPGTRKLKGVKGIRNGKGARFPVYAREIETKKYARA